MIAILSLVVLMSAYLIANALNRTSTEVGIERDQRTVQALREAKAALIAWAANVNSTQPGALPCPDTNNDGIAEGSCSGATVTVGRLPWQSLGIDDLRDASGERLWYALSTNFRKLPGTTTINSDSQGQLGIAGTTVISATSGDVVAVVLAPGQPVAGQNRSAANVNSAASYLESTNAGTTGTFTTAAQPSDTFNDRVMPITRAELWAVVEPVVAARIQSDLVGAPGSFFNNYKAAWGRYPFAVAFGNPGTSTYRGTLNQQWGLLPVTNDSTFVVWNNPTATTVTDTGATAGSVNAGTGCAASTASQLICEIYYSSRPTVQIVGTALNVGMSFVQAPSPIDVAVVNFSGGSTALSNYSNTWTTPLPAIGRATVTRTMRLPSGSGSRHVRITISVPPYSGLTYSTDPNAGWFISNQWYKQVYYAVSPAWVPGGPSPCVPSGGPASTCLTVNNLPPSYLQTNDKQVILVLGGRALNGTVRPSSSLGDYLEGQNATPADFVYEHRSGTPTSINDRVVVVSP